MPERWQALPARVRLTVLFGVLFLVAGVALIGVSWFLLHQRLGATSTPTGDQVLFRVSGPGPRPGEAGAAPGGTAQGPASVPLRAPLLGPDQITTPDGRTVAQVLEAARTDAERQLLLTSAVALAVVAVATAGAVHLLSGRVLRPVHDVSAAARRISQEDLHERLPVPPSRDELRELVETFNGMLGRLEAGFAAQRLFVANASHELATPLTTQRTLLEVAVAGDGGQAPELREAAVEVLRSLERQERTLTGLLTLARAQHATVDGLDVVDLHAVVRRAVAEAAGEAQARGVDVRAEVGPGLVEGNQVLLGILAANLVRNAVLHNTAGGWARVDLNRSGDVVLLAVENSGPVVSAERVEELLAPFRRGAPDRVASGGAGLGLAIVAAVARAHGADLRVVARREGGLRVEVAFAAIP